MGGEFLVNRSSFLARRANFISNVKSLLCSRAKSQG